MFKRVAVLGAGVMGSGIACQLANNKVEVLLFDLENGNNLIALDAIKKQLSSPQSGLTHQLAANLITPLSLSHDLEDIASCDLIIEAIVEKIDIKQKLYRDLEKYMNDGALLVSNTSTFTLKTLTDGMSPSLKSRMAICHFFNPPRYLKLLELIPGALSKARSAALSDFLTFQVGKEVVECNDTAGFIANRLGCFLMELILGKALSADLNITEIDAALINFFGMPSTGIFGLYDLIGIDVMNLISKSLRLNLSAKDKFAKISKSDTQIEGMIKDGYTGRKGKGGFYKQEKNEKGEKVKYALNLQTKKYEKVEKVEFAEKTTEEFLASKNKLNIFIKDAMEEFFAYVLEHQEEICNDFYSIDIAMKLGFGWKSGPYEMMQKYNLVPKKYVPKFPAQIDELKIDVKCKALKTLKQKLNLEPIIHTDSTSLWKITAKKLCLEIHTKMHTLSPKVFMDLIKATVIAQDLSADLIIYSDFDHFSAGADLNLFYDMALNKDMIAIDKYLELGQRALNSVKNCKMPVISCAPGVALGGGCELLFYSDYIIAHQELKAGLVETSIGLIPAFGGLKEAIISSGNDAILKNRLKYIMNAYKSTSALDFAIKMGMKNMSILANNNNLLDYALNCEFTKPNYGGENFAFNLSDIVFEDITEDEKRIADLVLKKLPKDLFNEEKLLQMEREVFCELIQTDHALEKIKAVIKR
ncbi:MAG: 3-hydroxyacyl-CoA dehydrogenase/enoyl-CoA hydratase family protein [Rickettsiaceae bacterium]|nr:3-hydroxyacyl-CoA dehydrogenase/enoyl-CoA hydratase family protein [Rickettsiaceae bacterium]